MRFFSPHHLLKLEKKDKEGKQIKGFLQIKDKPHYRPGKSAFWESMHIVQPPFLWKWPGPRQCYHEGLLMLSQTQHAPQSPHLHIPVLECSILPFSFAPAAMFASRQKLLALCHSISREMAASNFRENGNKWAQILRFLFPYKTIQRGKREVWRNCTNVCTFCISHFQGLISSLKGLFLWKDQKRSHLYLC